MTKKQREQVVELLRCAADVDAFCIVVLGSKQGYPQQVIRDACNARWAVSDERCGGYCDPLGEYDEQHKNRDRLEAAARVEEGSWP